MNNHTVPAWMVSLHGGHSRVYCDHAKDDLETLIQTAIQRGCRVYGLAEHAPRVEAHRLYREEVAMGWTVDTLDRLFTEYAAEARRLSREYADRITLLRGFEAEVVPEDRYVEVMRGYHERFGFDYMVGSVHWVAGHSIDYRQEDFDAAMRACGGLEPLAVRYYNTVAEMLWRLRPEIAAHLDLIRKCAPDESLLSTPAVRRAAMAALEAVRDTGAILDVNTAAYRNGKPHPYPAPWLVKAALEMGIPFCFGDDSHSAAQVADGIARAREYLLEQGVRAITVLIPCEGGLKKEQIALT